MGPFTQLTLQPVQGPHSALFVLGVGWCVCYLDQTLSVVSCLYCCKQVICLLYFQTELLVPDSRWFTDDADMMLSCTKPYSGAKQNAGPSVRGQQSVNALSQAQPKFNLDIFASVYGLNDTNMHNDRSTWLSAWRFRHLVDPFHSEIFQKQAHGTVLKVYIPHVLLEMQTGKHFNQAGESSHDVLLFVKTLLCKLYPIWARMTLLWASSHVLTNFLVGRSIHSCCWRQREERIGQGRLYWLDSICQPNGLIIIQMGK